MKIKISVLLLLPLLVIGQRVPTRIVRQQSGRVNDAATGTRVLIGRQDGSLPTEEKENAFFTSRALKQGKKMSSSSLRKGKRGVVDPPSEGTEDEDSTDIDDSSAFLEDEDPLGLEREDIDRNGGTVSLPPQLPWMNPENDDEEGTPDAGGVFFMQPHMVNHTLVFVSEGDLYMTRLNVQVKNSNSSVVPSSAMKLTSTPGNIRSPKIHPTLPLVAFTATYTGSREVYLQDWRQTKRRITTRRLTYWDHPRGVARVEGWIDETTLLLAAYPTDSSLQNTRLFELNLAKEDLMASASSSSNQQQPTAAMEITPVPLAQAEQGVYAPDDDNGKCLYFTRVRQNSYTIRYIGGTAENLWIYCTGQELALPLTANYNGTSKTPVIHHVPDMNGTGQPFLFFLSDRSAKQTPSKEWTPTTMNLWAMPLPSKQDVYVDNNIAVPIPLTSISCQMQGRSLQEYTIDAITNDVILRVGADLFRLTSEKIQNRLLTSSPQSSASPQKVHIQVFSDFGETQERIILANMMTHMTFADAFETPIITQDGATSATGLLTLRGQAFVVPVLADTTSTVNIPYQGSGQNIPQRRYRVAPGTFTAGAMRVLASLALPVLINNDDHGAKNERLSIVLATDPISPTAEHGFYMVRVDGSAANAFANLENGTFPEPFLGGHVNGGSTADGGLGTVRSDSVSISPCGRRMAWADTDGRICVMTIPLYQNKTGDFQNYTYTVLPNENELGEPMYGLTGVTLSWSPGARYLAINHFAGNQFAIISIVDCGVAATDDDAVTEIELGRIVQATPSRFNSFGAIWGTTPADAEILKLHNLKAELFPDDEDDPPEGLASSTIYFLTDRNIASTVFSPWGSRAPLPHFPAMESFLYALPLTDSAGADIALGHFSGGGTMEVLQDELDQLTKELNRMLRAKDSSNGSSRGRQRHLTEASEKIARSLLKRGYKCEEGRRVVMRLLQTDENGEESNITSTYPVDMDIDFGPKDLTFARTAYRLPQIPQGTYATILSQTVDGSNLVLIEITDAGNVVRVYTAGSYPSDTLTNSTPTLPDPILWFMVSTSRKHLIMMLSDGLVKIIPNTLDGLMKPATADIADTSGLALTVWPGLEYTQMFNDAWRMMRDYFWDTNMHNVDWAEMYNRYSPLVKRCTKREELDDVMGQMGAELSALHVFVHGGEYETPFGGDVEIRDSHTPASLGATLQRTDAWKGYNITEIPYRDPDFDIVGMQAVYSPLSDQALRLTGQKGLQVGDVITSINGEPAYQTPDIYMLLRGMAGKSVRLEVLRLASGNVTDTPVPVMVVPISQMDASNLRVTSWEWNTREMAERLAADAGFTVGYVHLRSMLTSDMNDFARGFFEDYDKQAFILDVRHNSGGNIDSWISTLLQRKAWSYFGGRYQEKEFRVGENDWNQQMSFNGHIVVLINENTSSDGEGIARSMSELGLGRLIGTRTWGGGIWLTSSNRLVDGGILSAPEFGIFNENWGWGMGVEMTGVSPDIVVDNNPRTAYDGIDTQLEAAIAELKQWLQDEPVIEPKSPHPKPDISLKDESCIS